MRSIVDRLTQKDLEDGEDGMKLKSSDSIALELEGERQRALVVLTRIMEKLKVVNAYAEMRIGDWRDPGPFVDLRLCSFQ